MPHKPAESEGVKTPRKQAISRPKSMFAKLSPGNYSKSDPDDSLEHPEIPKKSPQRMKRFSMMLRPSTAAAEQAPPRTPNLSDQDTFLKSPLASPGLQRQSSFQPRSYNYENKEEDNLPASPRRSIYSQTTPSRSSLHLSAPTKPLFLEKKAPVNALRLSTPSIGGVSPQLFQSPQFDTQNSIWISEDLPKRTSMVGRSSSVRTPRNDNHKIHRKTSSQSSGLKVSMIGPPQLMETTNQMAASTISRRSLDGGALLASPIILLNSQKEPEKTKDIKELRKSSKSIAKQDKNTTKRASATATPVISTPRSITPLSPIPRAPHTPKYPQQQHYPAQTPPRKESQSSISSPRKSIEKLKKFFKLDRLMPDSHPRGASSQRPLHQISISTPVGLPIGTPTSMPKVSDRKRKSQSVTAVPTRPSRQPDISLLRQESEISLDSSSGSSNSGNLNVLKTPINVSGASPRIYGDHEWDYTQTPQNKNISNRHSMIEGRRDRQNMTTADWI